MDISEQTLFKKMEIELQLAKNASTAKDRAMHLHGLAVLIEVMEGTAKDTTSEQIMLEKMTGETSQTTNTVPLDGKKIELDDGANGDSLLDF